jgi:hypothetical protein
MRRACLSNKYSMCQRTLGTDVPEHYSDPFR